MTSCALCKKDSSLRKSHIIPEFLYKTLYDEKHKLHVLTTKEDERNHTRQKGIWEYLLCGECEVMLSKYERYASLVLNGGVELDYERNERYFSIKGIDYRSFKLFQLSILWRASVSKNELFGEVQLGRHEEVIRKMILSGTPGGASDYGCIMYGLNANGRLLTDLIGQPVRIRFSGYVAYRFTFGGIVWTYVVTGHFKDSVLAQAFLSQDQVYILNKDFSEFRSLVEFGRSLNKMGRI